MSLFGSFGDFFTKTIPSAASSAGGAIAGAATTAGGAIAGAATTAGGAIAGGVVSGAEAVAHGVVSTANTVADGVVSTANTVSHGVVGAANTVSDGTLAAWKTSSAAATTVGYAFQATGLTMGQGMIDGANVAAEYGKIGVDQTYKGLVAAKQYVTQHACDIALGSFLASVFVALAADGEEEVTFGGLAAACAVGTVSRVAIQAAADAIAVGIVEPIFAIPGVASAVGHKDAFRALLAWVIVKAASEKPQLVVGSGGQFVAALVIATVTRIVCEGEVPAGGPRLWAGLQGEQPDPAPAPTPRTFLRSGEFLTVNQYLVSANRQYFLIMQSDGNLCIYKGTGPGDNRGGVWCSMGLGGGGVFYAIMQSDGNLCVYPGTGPGDNRGGAIWNASVTSTGSIFYALLQDDGNLSVSHGLGPAIDGGVIWSAPRQTKVASYLTTNSYLRTGGYLVSPSGNCFLILQTDGNLCIYKGTGPNDNRGGVWCSMGLASGGVFFAIQQADGNLCVYKGTGPNDNRGGVWCSMGLGGGGVFCAALRDDCNLVVTTGTGPADSWGAIWSARPVAPANVGIGLRLTTHCQDVGDAVVHNNEFGGSRGLSRRLEGFQLNIDPPIAGLSCQYMAHEAGIGDVPWGNEGSFEGTRGQSRAIEGFTIQLTGPAAAGYKMRYMAHQSGLGDSAFATSGQFCGTRGQSRQLEGMLVQIVKK